MKKVQSVQTADHCWWSLSWCCRWWSHPLILLLKIPGCRSQRSADPLTVGTLSIYRTDIDSITHRHDLLSHFYADDFQLYLRCRRDSIQATTFRLNSCISEIDEWMASNRLNLNQELTDILWCPKKCRLRFLDHSPLLLSGAVINPSAGVKDYYYYRGSLLMLTLLILPSRISPAGPSVDDHATRRLRFLDHSPLLLSGAVINPSAGVKDLGVLISNDLSMTSQVNLLVSQCVYHLRRIKNCCRALSRDVVKTLVNSFVTSSVDSCNGLLAGTPALTTNKLQRVHNTAAKVIYGGRKFDHVTLLLRDKLHWLKITRTYNLQTVPFDI